MLRVGVLQHVLSLEMCTDDTIEDVAVVTLDGGILAAADKAKARKTMKLLKCHVKAIEAYKVHQHKRQLVAKGPQEREEGEKKKLREEEEKGVESGRGGGEGRTKKNQITFKGTTKRKMKNWRIWIDKNNNSTTTTSFGDVPLQPPVFLLFLLRLLLQKNKKVIWNLWFNSCWT
eukprot:GHVS01058975.1.p2 GENE.GHVS01058975.1~~GHVS01058975.1.p2  ORF type:complete len:174 (+),score=51.66 GHVS01058975.1:234-755(+)